MPPNKNEMILLLLSRIQFNTLTVCFIKAMFIDFTYLKET